MSPCVTPCCPCAVHVAYLGTDQPSLNLNFSKNANMVVAQYYQFLRLGFEGYRKIMANLMKVSGHLAEGILATGGQPCSNYGLVEGCSRQLLRSGVEAAM